MIEREEIAQWLARSGSYDEAVTTARLDTAFYWIQYELLARIRAIRGDVPGALSMVSATIAPEHATFVRKLIAADAAERGDTADAFRISRDLTGPDADLVKLAEAKWQIAKGDLAHAESTIASVAPSRPDVGYEWASLARAYLGRGDEAQWTRVAGLVPAGEGDWEPETDRMKLVAHSDWQAAIAIGNARPLLERAEVFTELAREMARTKDTAKASQACDLAVKGALRIKDDVIRLQELAGVSIAQRDLSLPPTAAALMVVPDMTHRRGQPYFACEVVSTFASVGRLKDVIDIQRREDCAVGEYHESRAQFEAGDVDGAIRTVDRENKPGLLAMRLEGWIQSTTARSDMPEALRLFAILEAKGAAYDGEVSIAAAAIVRGMARTDPARALEWSRTRRTANQKVAALTELAREIIKSRDSTAAFPMPAR